jgi:hypothetical protein
MQKVKTKYYQSNAGRKFLSAGLILLLLFLTSVNYFLYPGSGKSATAVVCATDTSDEESPRDLPNSPAGPDEKSPNAPVSITEEYVHEYDNPINPLLMNAIFQHMVHETEKLQVVHFELLSPPPEA